MSTLPEQVASKAPVSSPVVEWSRVLGGGSIHRDFGHQVATNLRGEILVAARLDPLEESPPEKDDTDKTDRDDATVDLSRGKLIKLSPSGELVWCVALRAARLLPAPHLALDASGCAYVAGPYAPSERGLRGATQVMITKLRPDGSVEWSRSLPDAPVKSGDPRVPMVRVAAAPGGGACATWIGERPLWRGLRTLRLGADGGTLWDHAWPIIGEAHDPRVGLDSLGAAVVWGTFRGTLVFDEVTIESKVEGRYLARILEDGVVSWSYPLRATPNAPFAMAVGPEGQIGQVSLVPPPPSKSTDASPVLALRRFDASGEPQKGTHGRCERHASLPWLSLAPLGSGGFAIAGYFSGGIQFGEVVLHSAAPACEAVFVAWTGSSGALSAVAFQGSQLQAGLSIDGVSGGVVLSGWLCGTLNLGAEKLKGPSHTAGLFLAKLTLP